jgi:hypothetical protein
MILEKCLFDAGKDNCSIEIFVHVIVLLYSTFESVSRSCQENGSYEVLHSPEHS